MHVARKYTKAGQDAYAEIEFRQATSEIKNPDGSIVFRLENIEVPASWSQVATDILAQKYCRKAGVPTRTRPVAERGVPAGIAAPYARTPELIEIFAAAPVGPLLDYAADGSPQVGPTFLNSAQQKIIAGLQERIVAAAGSYRWVPDAPMNAALARCVLGRLLTQPTAAEVAALADWPIDGGMDGGAARPLAPELVGDPASWTRAATAWPVASVLRKA
mgnify:CR=1 FL=1